MSWLLFAASATVLVAFLYIPGFLLLRSLRLDRMTAVSYAPIMSTLLYIFFAIAFSSLGVKASWLSLFPPIVLIGVAACGAQLLISRKRSNGTDKEAEKHDWFVFFLYPLLASVVFGWLMLSQLPNPDAIVQQLDNTFHTSLVQAFFESGDYSPLNCTLYPEVEKGGYYPALFHELGAMVMSATGCSAGMAENVVLFVMSAVVFPMGMHRFIMSIARDKPSVVLACAIATPLFKGFPVNLIMWAIFPNLTGYCFIPLILAAFVSACSLKGIKVKAVYLLLFVFANALCVFAHPCALFAYAVLIFPYVLSRIWRLPIKATPQLPRPYLVKSIIIVALCIAVAILWYLAYYSPFLSSVTGMMWAGFTPPAEAVLNTILLAYRPLPIAQPALAILVIVGIVRCFRERQLLWIAASFAFASFIYAIGIGSNGLFKQILTGFWYTDTIRIGGFAAIAAMPLAALGLALIGDAFTRLLSKRPFNIEIGVRLVSWSHIAAYAVCVVLVMLPNYIIPNISDPTVIKGGFSRGDLTRTETTGVFSSTAVSAAQKELHTLTDLESNMITQREIDFADEVARMISEDAPVLNNPNDGSMYLYPCSKLKVCFRRDSISSPYLEQSNLIRLHLNEYATNSAVQKAVEDAGLEYVILLDGSSFCTDDNVYFNRYQSAEWTGVDSITDDTPGFEAVLKNGDMRLYKIG